MTTALSIVVGEFGRISVLDVDRPVVEHAHPQCHVLIKVGGADSNFEVGNRRYPLRFGTAVLVDSWRIHAYPYPKELPGSAILALYIEPKWLAEIDRKFSVSSRRDFFLHPCVELAPKTQLTAMQIAEELGCLCPDRTLIIKLVEGLMVEIVTSYSRWKEMRLDFGPLVTPVSDYRIRNAVEMMSKNALSLKEGDLSGIASKVGLSRAHFFELFRQNTSLTPRLFWNMLRMEEAYRKITGENRTMGSISQELGFRAQSQFTRFFAMNHGVSPSMYRRAALRL